MPIVTRFPRPALSPVALIVVAGWMVAGMVIVGTSLVDWPPVSSPLLDVTGWEVVTLATGAALAVGGGLVLAAAHPRLKLSTRWRVEVSGVWLLGGAWVAYMLLSWQSAQAVAVLAIMAGHVLAAVCRLRDILVEERETRALPGAEGGERG